MNKAFFIIGAVLLGFGLSACSSSSDTPGVDPCVDCNDDLIAEGTYDTTRYEINLPSNLPPLPHA